jgi:hypothetical protein
MLSVLIGHLAKRTQFFPWDRRPALIWTAALRGYAPRASPDPLPPVSVNRQEFSIL